MTRGDEQSQNKKRPKKAKKPPDFAELEQQQTVGVSVCECVCVCAVNVYNKSARLVTHLAHEQQQQANAVPAFLLV